MPRRDESKPGDDVTDVESVSVTDLDSVIAETIPREDASREIIVETCNRWQTAIVATLRKTAVVAWRIGGLLRRLREDTPHGQWEDFVEDDLDISVSTVRRYIRLADHFKSEKQIGKRTLMQAYEEAMILRPARTIPEEVVEDFGEILRQIRSFETRIRSTVEMRKVSLGKLHPEHYEEGNGMLAILRVDLSINQALKSLRDSINICERTEFYDKCDNLPKWVTEDKWFWFAADSVEKTPIDCIPRGVFTDEDRRLYATKQKFVGREKTPAPQGKGFANRERYPDGPHMPPVDPGLPKW